MCLGRARRQCADCLTVSGGRVLIPAYTAWRQASESEAKMHNNMFLEHMGGAEDQIVNRIEFKYVEDGA